MELSFISAISNVTTLLKLLQLGEGRTREAGSFFRKFKNEEKFQEYFILGHTKGLRIPKTNITAEQISCALQLSYAAGQIYKESNHFKALRLLADLDDRYGSLTMEDYFVAPSYVDRETYRQRENLLLEETYDPRQLSRRIGGLSHVPQDYVSSSLFGSANRVIVTGNPGVGKSTFSRWLCHQWVNDKMQLSGIPLHVELSRLREESDNRLCAYLKRTYLPKAASDTIRTTLSQLASDYIFILDGFDELDAQAQRRLRQDLFEVSPEVKYVLLSRPYGLLDGPNFVADFGLRIDGFTRTNIETYVAAFLNINKRGGERATFMQFLKNNEILADYAHTPLLLSFMVYLFLADTRQFERLENVYSRYELQHRVFEWLEAHESQKNRILAQKEILEYGKSTAYEMQITQVLWTDYADKRKNDRIAAKAISELGLGNLRRLNNSKDRFSFATLTFQEYLAAGFIHDRVTANSLAYLNRYKFFWNFSAMLIGSLGFNDRDEVIRQILDYYLDRWVNEGRRDTDSFLFLIHLAEVSRPIVDEYTAGDGIRHCMTAYQLGFYNPYWRQPILDAFTSVYGKAPLIVKRIVENWLYSAVEALVTGRAQTTNTFPDVEYAKALIVQLRFHEKEELVAQYVSLIKGPIMKGTFNVDNTFTDESFEGISFVFDEILQARRERWTPGLNDKIRSFILNPDLLELYSLNCYKVFARLADERESVNYLEDQLKSLGSEKIAGKISIERLKACAGGIYLCGTKSWQPRDKQKISDLLRTVTDAVIEGLVELESSNDFDTGEIGALAIEGLVCFDDPNFYNDLLKFGDLTEVQTLSLSVPNAKEFFTFFKTKLTTTINSGSLDDIVAAIELVDDIRHQFGRIRTEVGSVLINFVEQHYASFSNYETIKDYNFVTANDESTLPLSELNFFLQRIIFDDRLAASDRQYLADRLSGFREVAFFKDYFYPIVWGDEFFQFFRGEYWDCLKVYRQSFESDTLLRILSNPTIYSYQGNTPRIQENLSYLCSLPPHYHKIDDQHAVFRVCGYTMGMIRKIQREEPASTDVLIRLIEQLIVFYQLGNVYIDNDAISRQDGKSLLLAPFLYSLSGTRFTPSKINFERIFHAKGYESARFSEAFIDGFVHDGKLDRAAFNLGLEVLDAVTANRIMENLSLKPYLVEPFQRSNFESTLNL